jgi:hypothetical protein
MQVNARSTTLALRLLGQCLLGSPGLFSTPDNFLYVLWPAVCYLLAWPCYLISTDPTPLLSIDFPCGPLYLPPSVLIWLGVFDWWLSLLATCSCWFLTRGFFYPEDGGDTFLRNVGSHKIYMAPHS